MTGTRVRAVFTDQNNDGDGLGAATKFARLLAASGADDPQEIALANACWIARASHVDGNEV